MQLKLTEEQRNYVKITFNNDRFEVRMGEKDSIMREYYSVEDMLREFEENGIESEILILKRMKYIKNCWIRLIT